MRRTFLIISLFLLSSGFLGMGPAHAQLFFENFDSYADGSQMHGQGGWKGWGDDSSLGALVTSANSLSSPHSVVIAGASDLVHEFSGADSGIVTVTAWQYIPSGFAGYTYFILLNSYDDAGTTTNWSTQLHFDSVTGQVVPDGTGSPLPLTLIYDQWVQIRVVINHTADTQDIYYNGDLLVSTSWTDGVSGGGAQNLAAIDLFANGSTSVYYDDILVSNSEMDVQGGSGPTSITDGDLTPSTTDGTDFGSVPVGSNTSQTYTIVNTGTGILDIGTIVIGGTNAGDFTLTVNPSATVAAGGGTTTFTVQFAPAAAGLRTATISIPNTDADENPYDFSIQGTGSDAVAAIPTLNEWGMILFMALVTFGGVYSFRRQKQVTN